MLRQLRQRIVAAGASAQLAEKVSEGKGSHPSAAEAAHTHSAVFTAQLKQCPFKAAGFPHRFRAGTLAKERVFLCPFRTAGSSAAFQSSGFSAPFKAMDFSARCAVMLRHMLR
jgi:hypothetical protein